MSARSSEAPPAALLWGGAGMVAAVVHLMLVQQGLAAMGNARAAPPPALPVIEVMALASTVQGQDQPIESARPVASEALRPQSSAERLTASSPSGEKAQMTGASAALAAIPAIPSAAAAPKLAAVSPASSAATSTPAEAAAQSATTAPLSPIAPTAPTEAAAQLATLVPPAPRVAPAAPTVQTGARLAPSVSTATVARPAAPAPRQPGLSPVLTRPDSTAPVAVRPAALPPPIQTPAEGRPDSTAPVSLRPAPSAGPAASASTVAPAATSAARVAAIAPVASVAPSAQPAAPATLLPAPVAPAPASLAPVPSLPPPASSAAREGIAAPLPDSAPEAPPNENTYDAVLDHLADMPQPDCFAALPSLSDEGAFQLEVFARDAAALTEFRNRLETRVGQRMPNTTMKPISADQCAVMSFVTGGPSYPRFKLFFDLPRRVIQSGEALEGRIGNTSGGFVTFLVIDDEGTVQDLATFLQFVPGGAQFSIPLSLTAGPVETQQLLLVLSTPARLRVVELHNGTKADSFFPLLAAELRERGQTEDAALVAFSVR